ncbi:MAG: SPOR domain-containing protein [Nitrosomonadales bacterium]|nr:SPOR domain-containing protein [Nitrosomonadales bacterium]
MDEESNLKRQARRRLIGAVALTTAIVVLLPVVLDSEPKPAGQDIELRIPGKDKAGEFAPKIDLPPTSLPAATPPLPSSPVAAAPVLAASQVAATPEAAAAPQAAAKDKPAEQPQAAPQPAFAVQVGAYSKTDTAHYLQKKLSKEGFKAYTEKVADKTRVRTGPYASREAAEKARLKLEAQGLHPEIVTLPQ